MTRFRTRLPAISRSADPGKLKARQAALAAARKNTAAVARLHALAMCRVLRREIRAEQSATARG